MVPQAVPGSQWSVSGCPSTRLPPGPCCFLTTAPAVSAPSAASLSKDSRGGQHTHRAQLCACSHSLPHTGATHTPHCAPTLAAWAALPVSAQGLPVTTVSPSSHTCPREHGLAQGLTGHFCRVAPSSTALSACKLSSTHSCQAGILLSPLLSWPQGEGGPITEAGSKGRDSVGMAHQRAWCRVRGRTAEGCAPG